MTTETRTDPRKTFAPRFLPWLLAVAAFAFYWFTLNRWVSQFNLGYVAKISGWTWQVEVVKSGFISRYLSLSLAAGAANSTGAECVFRGLRGFDARPAGAVGRVVAA
jgi:hypothetical protein